MSLGPPVSARMFIGNLLFIGNGAESGNFGLGSGGKWDKVGRAVTG